jgi:hypothetical protein
MFLEGVFHFQHVCYCRLSYAILFRKNLKKEENIEKVQFLFANRNSVRHKHLYFISTENKTFYVDHLFKKKENLHKPSMLVW